MRRTAGWIKPDDGRVRRSVTKNVYLRGCFRIRRRILLHHGEPAQRIHRDRRPKFPHSKIFAKKRLTTALRYGIIILVLKSSTTIYQCASGGIGRLAGFRCQCSQGRAGSTPASRTNLNGPTQSERIAVSCSDWVGPFCACSSCAPRTAGFFDFGCHMSPSKGKQYKIGAQNV